MRDVALYLRQQAHQNGLTIEAASELAGVHPNYLWRVEVGRIKRPSIQKLKALTRAVKGRWEEVGRLLDGDPAHDRAELEKLWLQEAASMTDEELARKLDSLRRDRQS